MPKTLFILNDPPYGPERSYNALRLAGSLSKRDGEEAKVFLLGDAASCAEEDQKVPQGYYNAEVVRRNVAWLRDRRVQHVHGCERDRRQRAHRQTPGR
jgi:uncharacterized protein involved in oxidation of intracellular sulfur